MRVIKSIVACFMFIGTVLILHICVDNNFVSEDIDTDTDILHDEGLYCKLNSVNLKLGDSQTNGYNVNNDGSFHNCVHCHCLLNQVNNMNTVNCEMYDCPHYLCDPARMPRDLDHPCCRICGDYPYQNNTDGVAAESLIDPAVPLTGDIYPGRFLHVPVCRTTAAGDQQLLALVGVLSLPAAGRRRQQFRRLYGAQLSTLGVRVVFVLGQQLTDVRPYNDFRQLHADDDEYEDVEAPDSGQPSDVDVTQRAVDAEARRYGDLLQSSVAEHYNHLTLKTVSLLHYAAVNCTPTGALVKTDDDVSVSAPLLVDAVRRLAGVSGVHGRDCGSCAVGRERFSWRVSEREWPWPHYPKFVLGPGYLVTSDCVAPLFRQALLTRYHHLEDVFVTGITAEAAGVRRHDWPGGLCTNPLPAAGDVCLLASCPLSHRVQHDNDTAVRRLRLLQYAGQRLPVQQLCGRQQTA